MTPERPVPRSSRGFSFIEVAVVLAIVVLIFLVAVPTLGIFEKQKSLDASLQSLMGTLRVAQSKTLASEELSSYGVRFDQLSDPQVYTLFKGNSFATRDPLKDKAYQIPGRIELFDVSIYTSEVVFDRVTGTTTPTGSISIRLKADPSQERSLYIDALGNVMASQDQLPSDQNRIVDSRHVHVDLSSDYVIQTTENVILNFPNGGFPVTQQFLISSNMQGGQIFWEGSVTVGGQIQELQILTHRFNDPALGTQFSIKRDKRYNTKDLGISLTGSGGTIIKYDVDGVVSQGSSIYAQEPPSLQ